jgi:hypothetical protein
LNTWIIEVSEGCDRIDDGDRLISSLPEKVAADKAS